MTRGLMKSSFIALTMAAGLATAATAADLGGNCCADLEERIAELEATTARKGTRKTSLTVYGWVNKTIMHWDAPTSTVAQAGVAAANVPTRGTYLGQDNTNSATRFGIRGDATINSEWKAGYSLLWDVASGARTATSTRFDEEARAGGTTGFEQDPAIRMRDGNVWLESSRIGRTTMGRLTGAGAVGTIDLGGIGNVAPGTVLSGNALTFSDGTRLDRATDIGADYGYRQDGLRWDSPSWAGFTISASLGETTKKNGAILGDTFHGRVEGVQIRYAGEFNGVRIAAGIGAERSNDLGFAVGGTATPDGTTARHTGGSLSLLHTATGLFIHGTAVKMERNGAGVGLGTWENDVRIVQAGLTRNFFGIGATVLYGEFHRYDIVASANVAAAAVGFPGGKTDIWGLGIVQNIDAAAMQLYAGYRNHSRDTDVAVTGTRGGAVSTGDIGVFLAGARINF